MLLAKTLHHASFLILLAAVFLLVASPAEAEWRAAGIPVAPTYGTQRDVVTVPDGDGGCILVWSDLRNGNYDIYAQRIDANGDRVWGIGGLPVCTAAGDQELPAMVSDGMAGTILVWEDRRAGSVKWDVYAQAIDADGNLRWATNGVGVCTQDSIQVRPRVAPDGEGGAYFVWTDYRWGTSDPDVMMQHLDASGALVWTANGLAIANSGYPETDAEVVADSQGGFIAAWEMDFGSGNRDIYGARYDAFPTIIWGGAICSEPGNQYDIDLVAWGQGQAILSWTDGRTINPGIYAQRMDQTGSPIWTPGGMLARLSSVAFDAKVAADPFGGAYVTWTEQQGSDYGIFAQHLASSGAGVWAGDGIEVCDATGHQWYAKPSLRGEDGIFVAWVDGRSGSYHLYAQGLDQSGTPLWTPDGFRVTTSVSWQGEFDLARDPGGGVILAWEEASVGENVFAQRLEPRYGTWGRPEPAVVMAEDNPADQGGEVVVGWFASARDRLDQRYITHYSVWRAVQELVPQAPGAVEPAGVSAIGAASVDIGAPNVAGLDIGAPNVTLPDIGPANAGSPDGGPAGVMLSDIGPDFSGPAVLLQDGLAWEWVGNQDAIYEAAYSKLVSTRQDSVEGYPADHWFRVIAHTVDPFTFFPGEAVTGHSVDNLAPAEPLYLYAVRMGSDVLLTWSPNPDTPDLGEYAVYRRDQSGVTPDPVFHLTNATDTTLVDTGAPGTALFYIVTAVDVHGNEGPPSNEAEVAEATGIGLDRPVPARLVLLPCTPNPFRDRTQILFGMPAPGTVRVEVYDVQGRVRWERVLPAAGPGWTAVPFAGRDRDGRLLPSGVYFTRVAWEGMEETGRIVLRR